MPVTRSVNKNHIPGVLRALGLAAVIVLFISIVLGGLVRLNQAGSACPDWPTCLGTWTLPAGNTAGPVMLNTLHRLATALAGSLLVAAALAAWRLRRQRLFFLPLVLALVLTALQGLIGAGLVSLPGETRELASAAHLGLAFLALGAAVVPVVVGFASGARRLGLAYRSPYSRLALVTLTALLFLLVSGAVVARLTAPADCAGWPLCEPQTGIGWLSLGHRLAVGITWLLVSGLFLQGWRTQRSQPAVLVTVTAAWVLFGSQALLGIRLVDNPPMYLLALHQATAVATWVALVVAVLVSGLAGRTAEEERSEALALRGRSVRGMALDLLLLTKPVVVLLLLVTTYAGMVIGARAWPSLSLTFWTLLGGFMAAGGSGAINQYLDRQDDAKMQRTQKRPIPAGRLAPAEGLAFGVGLVLASFFLQVAFVNLLAALLSLAGFIYYVLIYSIFLKKTTVQNIVIGGGAGAIPPLVGWAAATGGLNIPSLFLFAVVFMWTPPHFWALALVRRSDYARAGVPMLPVVRGEVETQKQILIYTIELVVLTMLLPLFGLGGSIYLVGAAVLGLWLLSAAWNVWKKGGNKLAWKMYRYSSMYLAFLFMVMMVDALVK